MHKKGVNWVRSHREFLINVGFFEQLESEILRYMTEHHYKLKDAGHAACNKVGREFYPRIKALLVQQDHQSLTQTDFLAYLRSWFDKSGINELEMTISPSGELLEEE